MTPLRVARRLVPWRYRPLILLAAVLALGGGLERWLETKDIDTDQATVARIVDGDTLILTTGTTVRIAGVDTPEARSYGRVSDECVWPDMAAQAAAELQAVAPPGAPVTLHVVDTDRYGRTVAHVTSSGVDVGPHLIARGVAVTWPAQDGHVCPGGAA